jgi:hypothetical protein
MGVWFVGKYFDREARVGAVVANRDVSGAIDKAGLLLGRAYME